MAAVPFASLVIPTYNRTASLLRTLASLEHQADPGVDFEIIVVDDGSSLDVFAPREGQFPFHLRLLRQANQGDAAARNTAVLHSQAQVVVFVDDDIAVAPDFLDRMLGAISRHHHTLVVGNLLDVPKPGSPPPFCQPPRISPTVVEPAVDFTELLSGFMAAWRQEYIEIGMLQGLTGKGPDAWCDVDFAYRAFLKNFRFLRSLGAVGYHYDQAAFDFQRRCRRCENVGKAGVLLLRKYPGLLPHLHVFHDKLPLTLKNDPPGLVARKIFRCITAQPPILKGMELLVSRLEHSARLPALLRLLHRWISSSYLYAGFRQGLREHVNLEIQSSIAGHE